MTTAFVLLVLAKFEATALRRDGRGLRLCSRTERRFVRRGGSKRRIQGTLGSLAGAGRARRDLSRCAKSMHGKCSEPSARSPSPPEPKIKRRTDASFFYPCSADAVGRAANFRANFHGAAAKLNALQAFNAPTCHGNSRNGSLRPRATADAQKGTRSAPLW